MSALVRLPNTPPGAPTVWLNPAHVVEVAAQFDVVLVPERRHYLDDDGKAWVETVREVRGDTVSIVMVTHAQDHDRQTIAGHAYVRSQDRAETVELLVGLGVARSDLDHVLPDV